MINFEDYTDLDKTVTFDNGKEYSVFSKMTKRGLRYFYWSGRFFPISKIEAGIL